MKSQLQPSPLAGTTDAYCVPRHTMPIDLKLDSNEGTPAISAFRFAPDDESLCRYPSRVRLQSRIAEFHNVAVERVIVTAGGDESLERAMRSVLAPGRELILPVPTFEMLFRYAAATGAEIRTVEWNGPEYPLAAVLAAIGPRTAAIAVVSPNNPTGGVISVPQLLQLAKAAPQCLLIIDLAYIEFADVDLTPVALSLPNAVTVRTFSKAWGLAGARLGYTLAPEEIIGWMNAVGGPYPVSALSIELGLRALEEGADTVRTFCERVKRERTELEAFLTAIGITFSPSQGNFVFARFSDPLPIWEALGQRGIAVRLLRATPGADDALRITCPGDAEKFLRLRTALAEAVSAAPTQSELSAGGVRQ